VGPDADLDPAFVHWRCGLDDRGRPRVEVAAASLGRVPELWFVEVPEYGAARPATSIVAFDDGRFAPGTVVADEEFRYLGVDPREQVGALRWYLDGGVVDQLFVAPTARRRGIGSEILFTADGFHQLNGWLGALRSDGRRTAMGESLVATLRFRQRIAPSRRSSAPWIRLRSGAGGPGLRRGAEQAWGRGTSRACIVGLGSSSQQGEGGRWASTTARWP
jgi:GNAT superfamily N-acetyltransferase